VKTLAKVAVTDRAAVMLTVHVVPETVLQPVQPVSTEPEAAAAVRVTVVPVTYDSVQSVPQLMPAGLELTVPVPPPARLTVNM
jgi:hypothetical protein